MKASTDQAGKTNQAKQTLAAVDDSYAGGTVSAAFFSLYHPIARICVGTSGET
jgi:hypothetical protein